MKIWAAGVIRGRIPFFGTAAGTFLTSYTLEFQHHILNHPSRIIHAIFVSTSYTEF